MATPDPKNSQDPSLIHLWHRLTTAWTRLPLRTKGIVLALIPLIAIGVSSTFAYLGNRERQRAETDVARHFDVVTDLEELLTLVVNAETGMRGYLLTHRAEFLQPYQSAAKKLPTKINELQTVVQQEPGEEPRVRKLARVKHIESLINTQMTSLKALQLSANTSNAQTLVAPLSRSKNRMDQLRAQLRLMRVEEKRLLSERLSEIQRVRQRDYIAIIVTLILSLMGRFLAMHLFNTGVIHRIQKIRKNVTHLGTQTPLPFEASDKSDPLGELEREVAQSHQRLRPT